MPRLCQATNSISALTSDEKRGLIATLSAIHVDQLPYIDLMTLGDVS